MRGCLALWFVVGALSGCHSTPEQDAQDFCLVVCRCGPQIPGANLPIDQAVCVPQCLQQIVPLFQPTDDCVQCLFDHENRCSTIIQECTPQCQVQQPPTGGGTADAAITIDAF